MSEIVRRNEDSLRWQIQLIAFLVSLIAALGLIFLTPQAFANQVVRVIDAALLDSMRFADGHSRINRIGYPIRVIQFDESSMVEFDASAQRPTIPHDRISEILDVIQASSEGRPAAVFLDVAILDSYELGDNGSKELEATLNNWMNSSNAPLLGVLAGKACEGEKRLQIDKYPMVSAANLSGTDSSKSKVLWACPKFDVAQMAEFSWSCVDVDRPGQSPTRIALPSLNWLGIESKWRQSNYGNGRANSLGGRLSNRLTAATQSCRGQGPMDRSIPTIDLPFLEGGQANYESYRIGESLLITPVSAAAVVSDGFDPELFSDTIVVIGGNHYFDDSALIANERVPGPYIAGLSLRDGLLVGGRLETPSWIEGLIALGTMMLIYFISWIASSQRKHRQIEAKGFFRRAIWAILTEKQLWIFVFLVLGFKLVGLVTMSTAFAVGIGVLCGELFLYLEEQACKWS